MALGFGPSGKFAVYQPLGHFLCGSICFPWCVVGGSAWVIFSPAHTYRGVQCIESRHGLICGQCCLFPCVQGLSWGYSSFHAAGSVEDRWRGDLQIDLYVFDPCGFKGQFQPLRILGGRNHGLYVDNCDADHLACIRNKCL